MQAFRLTNEVYKEQEKEKILNIPNTVTFFRVLFACLYVVSYWREENVYAFVCLALAAFTDLLDGWLARKLCQCTEFGCIFDAMADRLVLLAILGNIVKITQPEKREYFLILCILSLEVGIIFLLYFTRKKTEDMSIYRPYGKLRQFGHLAAGCLIVLRLLDLHVVVIIIFCCSLLAVYGALMQYIMAPWARCFLKR